MFAKASAAHFSVHQLRINTDNFILQFEIFSTFFSENELTDGFIRYHRVIFYYSTYEFFKR